MFFGAVAWQNLLNIDSVDGWIDDHERTEKKNNYLFIASATEGVSYSIAGQNM